MSIFEDLLGSGDTKTSSSTSGERYGKSSTFGRIGDKDKQKTDNVTNLLSSGVQRSLDDFLLGITKGGDAKEAEKANDDMRNIATLLASRAETAEADIGAGNAAILADARRKGERVNTRLQTDLAQQAGGTTGNSFVAGATAEASSSLESSLASLAAELDTSARGVATSELSGAIEALKAGTTDEATRTAAIASLVQSIKGAKTTEKGSVVNTNVRHIRETNNTSELIKQLTEGEGSTDGGLFGPLIDRGTQIASAYDKSR